MLHFIRRFSIKDRLVAFTLGVVLLPSMIHFLALFTEKVNQTQFMLITAVILVFSLFMVWILYLSILSPLKEWKYLVTNFDHLEEGDFARSPSKFDNDEFSPLFTELLLLRKKKVKEEALSKHEEALLARETPEDRENPENSTVDRLTDWLLMSTRLVAHLDMGENLRKILAILNGRLHLEWSSVLIPDLVGSHFRVLTLVGKEKSIETEINQSELPIVPISLNEGVAGKVFSERKTFLVNRGSRSPEFKKNPEKSESEEKIRSILCIPLIYEEQCLGVLNCVNRADPAIFRTEDVEYGEGVAAIIAFELHRHQVIKEVLSEEVSGLVAGTYWDFCFKNECGRAERFRSSLSLAILDVDGFKELNQKFDSHLGDEVLIEIAAIIQKNIRKIDFARRRLGKFQICLPGTTPEGVLYVISRIMEEVAALKFTAHGKKLGVTLSGGAASFPGEVHSPSDLILKATSALNEAKKGGRQRLMIFTHKEGEGESA